VSPPCVVLGRVVELITDVVCERHEAAITVCEHVAAAVVLFDRLRDAGSVCDFPDSRGIHPTRVPCWRSGFPRQACQGCMHIAYLVTTSLAAFMNGYAAALNFVGAESVKAVSDRLQLSQRWMVPFGILLASGAAGLLLGMVVPVLGTAAATGLVLYFICAVTAHLRVHDRKVGGAVFFLLVAVAALATDLAYRNTW
jgi:DoxX-like family